MSAQDAPDPTVDSAAAGDAGTPEAPQTPEWESPPALPFTLEEITDDFTLSGPEARSWLAARQAQMQGGFTKAVQTAKEKQKSAEKFLELQDRLSDESTRAAAAQDLLAEFGIEVEWDESEGTPAPDEAELTDAARELAELKEQVKPLLEDREKRTEDERRQAFYDVTYKALDAVAEAEGFKDRTDMPEFMHDGILARAMALPRGEDGFLDVDEGARLWMIERDAILATRREKSRKARDVPTPDLNANSADPAPEIGNQASRLARANAIAARHV